MTTLSADLYEMANVPTRLTGLRAVVFCSPKGNSKHACRVKVSNSIGKMNPDDVFVVVLHNLEIAAGECKLSVADLESVQWWIYYNRQLILNYWNYTVDTLDFLQSVKRIRDVQVKI